MSMNPDYEVVIIGSGCAGLSAGVYVARGGYSCLIINGDEPGGQLTLTTEVENYPGIAEGISGPELISNMEEQATNFGAETTSGSVTSLSRTTDGAFKITLSNETEYLSEAVIVASGASARTLGIPGEDELLGYGVSTCATCDGAFFRDEDMVVIGGGDAAAEEASFLTKFAEHVYIIHRRDELRAEQYWQDRLNAHIENDEISIIWNTEVTQISGSESDGVEAVTTVSHPDGHPTEKDSSEVREEKLEVGAVFLAIGHTPNTAFLEGTLVKTDEIGYIETEDRSPPETETTVSGLFACGDVVDSHYQQAVTAAGSGVKAALDVDQYLSE